jgi:hypothetical protein
MTVEKAITAFAGSMVLISLALWWLVHPGFIWLTVFVGFNLLQSSFTGFCPAAMVFRKMGIKTEAELATRSDDGPGFAPAA